MAKQPTKAMAKALGGAKAAKSTPKGSAPITRLSVSDGKTERSVSVRKIENGYIVRECTYGGKGGYKETERFSQTAPDIDLKGMKTK